MRAPGTPSEPDEPASDAGAPPPEQRTRFHRSRDVVAAVSLTVALVVAGVLVWYTSDIRATSAQPYTGPVTSPAPPAAFPPSLAEVWRAKSAATPRPVAAGPSVISADGGEVIGRDPLTGEERWRYARDLPLCTVAPAWSVVVAMYRTDGNLLPVDDPRSDGGCSEVTALDPATGKLGRQPYPGEERDRPDPAQRNSHAELGTRLIGDGTYVTATGRKLLLTWRSDLVKTMEYGEVPAIVNPDKQPRTGCVYGSVAVGAGKIAVLERCRDDPSDRLTVYRATNEDSDEPDVVTSVVLGGDVGRVVAVNDTFVAVVLADPARLVVLNESGETVAEYPVDLREQDLRGEVAGGVVPTAEGAGTLLWFTGSTTVALSTKNFRPVWTVRGTLGPGTAFAGRILLPVSDGIAVVDHASGQRIGTLPVDRSGYPGPVTMATIGPVVLEQRGDTLVALR